MTSHLTAIALLFGATFTLSVVSTFSTRAVTRRVGFVAKPRAERWHARPTALAGGVGVFLAFVFGTVVLGHGAHWGLIAGASAMFVLGFVDDVFHLRPYAKLIGQVVIAALTVLSGRMLPWTGVTVLDQAVSLFWIIGITNALNLLDNMDGLAGGTTFIAAAFQAVFFLLQNQPGEAAVAAALAAAVLGFLVFNWNPASIFMGDCGALFLGYTLATLATENNYGRSRGLLVTIAAPVLVMLVPIFDTTFVTLVRIVRGRPVSQGGRDHTSHRLVVLGLSERTAVGLLLAVGALGGTTAVLSRLNVMAGVWIGAPLIALALAFLGIHLARTDKLTSEAPRLNMLSSLAAFGYRRRVFEVCLDAVLAMIALVTAFLLRFDGDIPSDVKHGLSRIFLVVVAIKLGALFLTRAYDGVWRYIDVRDMTRLARGAILGSLLVAVVLGLWLRFNSVSRGALVIDSVLFAMLLMASRVSFRLMRSVLNGQHAASASGTPVILWGAGDLGGDLARQLLDNGEGDLVPVGFVDDDPLKAGRLVHGLPVHGNSGTIPMLLESGVASFVVVTSQRIPADRVAAIAARVPEGALRRMRVLFEDVRRSEHSAAQPEHSSA